MILYHGSLGRITAPEIRVPNRTLDKSLEALSFIKAKKILL